MRIDIQNFMDVPIYVKDMEGSDPTVKIEVGATTSLDTPRVLSIAGSAERLNVYTPLGSRQTRSG